MSNMHLQTRHRQRDPLPPDTGVLHCIKVEVCFESTVRGKSSNRNMKFCLQIFVHMLARFLFCATVARNVAGNYSINVKCVDVLD